VTPPPTGQTAEWIRFGITTLLSVPSAVLAAWLLSEKLRECRPDRQPTICKDPPTPAILKLSPSYGTSSASLTLTTGNDAGTQAVFDSMAELFPYEFPPN
jgi:hypothetical protein